MTRKLLLFSSTVIWNDSTKSFYPGIPESLKTLRDHGASTVIVSNRPEPAWFKQLSDVCQFMMAAKRQDGRFIPELVAANHDQGLAHNEIVVMGATEIDMQMATNSKSLLVRCEWSNEVAEMKEYGVGWQDPSTLLQLVKYLDDQVPWYFESSDEDYKIFALTNAGTLNVAREVEAAANKIRSVLKDGKSDRRNRLLLHLMSSIYKTEQFAAADIFSYYPSSKSLNDGSEVMAGFCKYARETFKKRHKEPLFIRHTPAIARHSRVGDRSDPTSQVLSICLNPFYKGKLRNKTVVVMDDYLTYGVSFGFAKALLEAAGAAKVICLALGKFGSRSQKYTFDLRGQDVFAPLRVATYSTESLAGTLAHGAQKTLVEKFGGDE